MKYESTILKRLINTYGVVGNPRYISEIIKEFIVRGKECFPNLFTYQANWLAHIDEFGLNPTYTVSYTGQSIYAPSTLEKPVKSAILKGSTKYRDIDTGEFLETFDETKNLELVSVRMPVLMTTGKNLFDKTRIVTGYGISSSNGNLTINNKLFASDYIEIDGVSNYTISGRTANFIALYDENKTYIKNLNTQNFNASKNGSPKFIRFNSYLTDNIDVIQFEMGMQSTSYEPYKTNILTVNEDVTLRSNGDVYDELNLLTGRLTQRIDENNEVLAQEVVKTVDLNILDQNGQNVQQLMSFNGGTHFNTTSLEGSPLPVVSVSVETDLEEVLMLCSLEGNTL